MNNSSRRGFLKRATGLVATGFVANSALGNTIQRINPVPEEREMIFRTLGRTGVKLPLVSMGVMNSNNPNLLKVGWQSGIRHFDTAWTYQMGNNEKMVGAVLRELNVNRKDVVITTKIVLDRNLKKPELSAERKAQFLSRFTQSLERLQMEYVDILMYHDVNTMDEVLDPVVMEAMQELKDQRKIRFTGFSTHVYWPELLTATVDRGFYDVVLLSLNYSMAEDEASLKAMQYAASKGVGLIAMKTQCQQDWYKQNLPAEAQKFYEGSLMHSALLKWVLHHEVITTAVPGFTTFEQLQTDVEVAYNLEYTKDETKFLEDHNVKLAMQSVCRLCGSCRPTCPRGVDIPSLMRTHMYAASYGNVHMMKSTLHGIEQGSGLAECDNCTQCVAQCRHSVQIAGRIEDLRSLLV
jgi:uncharacterized protein